MAQQHLNNHKAVVAKHGKKFCAAPFTSMHTLPNGDVTTCCKTRKVIGNLNQQTPEEIMNSEHVKKVRKEFLEGGMPAQCKNCWEYEDANDKDANNRVFSNHAARDAVDEAVASTDTETGEMSKHHPAWLDLLWTNKCNFACAGCSPELSDTIKRKYKNDFATINGLAPEDYHPDLTDADHNDNNLIIDYVLNNVDSLSMIHLNGGEPFMQEDTYTLLQALMDRGLQDKVRIWSHTNGSISKYKGIDVVETYLKHWKGNCKITISMDGHGERGEYIRWGMRTSKWLNTYMRLSEAGIDIGVQTCWNALNALWIDQAGEWLYDNLPRDRFGVLAGSLTVWQGHRAFDPRVLQAVYGYTERAVEALERCRDSGKHPRNWDVHFDGHIKYITKPLSEDELREKSINFIKGVSALDAGRDTNFNAVFPELADFNEELKDRYWL